jgi:UDP-N-acetyl-D-galactosamine dehydrogenase
MFENKEMNINSETIVGVVGLGYVGLPLLYEFSKHFKVVGFDVNKVRIRDLQNGIDTTGELTESQAKEISHFVSNDRDSIKCCNAIIIAVPTGLTFDRRPDLSHLESACRLVGTCISKGALVVLESTVAPGTTESFCIPILSRESCGLISGKDYFVGYSPERINPGDKTRKLRDIRKVIAPSCEKSRAMMLDLYSKIIRAGLFIATDIRTAEAAKLLENIQRDVNIALINEFSEICRVLKLDTTSVIETSASKWNFAAYHPGMVGGHCIGTDPYYLIDACVQSGYVPQLISSARLTNEKVSFRLTKDILHYIDGLIATNDTPKTLERRELVVGIMGLTFKEDCPDFRNSKILEVVSALMAERCTVVCEDPYALTLFGSGDVEIEGIEIRLVEAIENANVLVIAVGHSAYRSMSIDSYVHRIAQNCKIIDIHSATKDLLMPLELERLFY